MQNLIKFFTIYVLLFTVLRKASADIPTLENNYEYNSMVTMALFNKLNMLINETQKFNEQFKNFNKRLQSLENIRKFNLQNFKTEIRELLKQNYLKMENSLWQMNEKVLENFELQNKTLKNLTTDVGVLKNFDAASLKQNHNWQTILRRQDGSENFNRTWNEYKTGFGQKNGEFFIGLEKLHIMTMYSEPQELLIILQDFANQTRYAKYNDFLIGSENEKYTIKKLGKFYGDAKDSFSQHLNYAFSTYDQDNANATMSHCAKEYPGGWWFSSCFYSHLTGPYLRHSQIDKKKEQGIVWYAWHGVNYSLKYVEMLIRPKYVCRDEDYYLYLI
ncbi:fibrinogen-like protein 1 isoform X2 [Lucilia sericata]|uniref:fibrinogen-like protein 1 isoform X2 n=1 Tax=Lucilia sericata TaxID=13632 RepID=UPI0018A842B4|nr:fibrinogen-like protein 1 isoform X2 [Lucilia sericata]